jgi:hypothetical protein
MSHLWIAYVGNNYSWLSQPTILAAVLGGLLGTVVPMVVGNYRTKRATKNLVRGQLEYIHRKAVEFGKGEISELEFKAGEPLYKSLYETFGFLSQPQAAASSVAHLLYFEIAGGGCRKERTAALAKACKDALDSF